MKTNFENRLKHQIEIDLCAFVDLGLQGHTPTSHTSGFGIEFKISIKRYF